MSSGVEYWIGLWAGALGRASWQGAVAILAVWIGCALLPHASPRVRHWLWRLVYVKLLVALVWAPALVLPLLPAREDPFPAALPNPVTAIRGVGLPSEGANGGGPTSSGVSAPGRESSPGATDRSGDGWGSVLLLLLWGAGAGVSVLRLTRERRSLGRLRSRCGPPSLRQWSLLRHAVEGGPLPAALPEVLVSSEVATPMLVGVRRPAVILPALLLEPGRERELGLILCHELTHLERRDLLWAWLPALARILFFFHPLVWLAEREWRLTAEMACDEAVIRRSPQVRTEYGRLLLALSLRAPEHAAGLQSAGIAESYDVLKRRLTMIARPQSVPLRRVLWSGTLLVLCGILAVLPLRVGAQAPAATEEVNLAQQWEDILLLDALTYLRISPHQLASLRPVVQSAAARMRKVEEEEAKTRAALGRVARRQREALVAGASVSLKEQREALELERRRRGLREQASEEIAVAAAPKLARLLTAEQVRRALLLAAGEAPANEAKRPAIFDPESGFVAPADEQERLHEELTRRVLVRQPGPVPPRAGEAQSVWMQSFTLRSYQDVMVDGHHGIQIQGQKCESCHAAAPRALGRGTEYLDLFRGKSSGSPTASWSSLSEALVRSRREEDHALALRRLARRLLTSPRIEPVLEERLRLTE